MQQATERRISASLRITLAALLLLLNIGVILLLTVFLRAHSTAVFLLLEALAVVVAIGIQSTSAGASSKLVWTLLVVAFPVGGVILYLLWGGGLQQKRLNLLPVAAPGNRGGETRQAEANRRTLARDLPNWVRVSELLTKRDFLLYGQTSVQYFATGEAYFEDMLKRMAAAERFIFIEYFILAEGKLWERMEAVLLERAAHGVEIKIIFDDFGSIYRMGGETLHRLQEAGIEVHVFNPVHRYVNRLYFNYRDHRKIVSIDGQYGYTGGVNVGDEYTGYVIRHGEWKDGGVLLDGAGAWGLTRQFIHMWEMVGRRLPNEDEYYRPLEGRAAAGWVQPYADGPINNPDNPAEDLYLQCITNAREYIWITTPYFAVEDTVVRALCIAADGGVDVRLLLPGIPDHKYTYIVYQSHYARLLAHGVKIYEYTPGFVHLKSFVVDGEVGQIGTVNMDYRSFQYHFECGVVLYKVEAIEAIRKDLEGIIRGSKRIDAKEWGKRRWYRKVLEKVLRIFAIWM